MLTFITHIFKDIEQPPDEPEEMKSNNDFPALIAEAPKTEPLVQTSEHQQEPSRVRSADLPSVTPYLRKRVCGDKARHDVTEIAQFRKSISVSQLNKPMCLFQKDHGGIRSIKSSGHKGDYIYYFGIIGMEHSWKKCTRYSPLFEANFCRNWRRKVVSISCTFSKTVLTLGRHTYPI